MQRKAENVETQRKAAKVELLRNGTHEEEPRGWALAAGHAVPVPVLRRVPAAAHHVVSARSRAGACIGLRAPRAGREKSENHAKRAECLALAGS